jgi:hypothetical protein
MVYYNLLITIGGIYYQVKKNNNYMKSNSYDKKSDDTIISLLGLLDVFIENSINVECYLTKNKYNDIINELYSYNMKLNNIIKKVKKLDNKIKVMYDNTNKIFKIMCKLTGCNVYLTNLNIPDITINELFYVINSIYPVLHILKINKDSFLVELQFDNDALKLCKELDNSYIFDDGSNKEYNNVNNTMNAEYIDKYINNNVMYYSEEKNKYINCYKNIYNNKLYPLDILENHCELKKIEYHNSDGNYIDVNSYTLGKVY